jgi:signal transduction histidine kinase
MSIASVRNAEPIRVVIADDTDDIRLLLRAAFARTPDVRVVGEARNGLEAVRLTGSEHPDAVVLDLAMPEMDGLRAIPEILRVDPGTKIVVLSGFGREDAEREAMERGAHAYVEKGRPFDEILSILRAVYRGTIIARAPARATERADVPADVLATLGHELSSPVAVISGFAGLLRRGASTLSTAEIVEYAGAIARSGAQLEDLIRAFYDARQLEGAGIAIDRRDADLEEIVRHVVTDLSEAVGPHELRLGGSVAGHVSIDAARIRATVQELIVNAAKFSPRESPVDVELGRQDGTVAIAVTDHCGGIAGGDRPRLFERFGKLRNGGPGMGLGLYVARGVARAHGGDVLYEPLDDGCRFTLVIPA